MLLTSSISAPKRIFHELHIRDQTVLNLAPIALWTRASLPQRLAPAREASDDGYILAASKTRVEKTVRSHLLARRTLTTSVGSGATFSSWRRVGLALSHHGALGP